MVRAFLAVTSILAFVLACGGSEEAKVGSPIVGDIEPGIVVAITEHMATSGLEGDTSYILLDPPECAAQQPQIRLVYRSSDNLDRRSQSRVHGIVCVAKDKSTIGDGAAQITLAYDGAPTITWQVDLAQAGSAWRVTSVKYTGG